MNYDPKSLWNEQERVMPLPMLSEIKDRARAMHRRLVWRDRIEYAAGLFCMAVFAYVAFVVPVWTIRAACALIVIGIVVTCFNLYRRKSVAPDESASFARNSADFHLEQLRHQHSVISSVATWYIGPIIPGVIAFLMASVYELSKEIGFINALIGSLPSIAMATLILLGVFLLNMRAARKLKSRIEELESSTR